MAASIERFELQMLLRFVTCSCRHACLGRSWMWRSPWSTAIHTYKFSSRTFSNRTFWPMKALSENIDLLKEETMDKLLGPDGIPLDIYLLRQTNVIWKFDDENSLKKWEVSTDKEIGGKSEASISFGKSGRTLLFQGSLSTEPAPDGKVRYSGYSTLRSKKVKGSFGKSKHYDWSPFNVLHLRVRGDGRPLMVFIIVENFFNVHHDDLYNYFIYTRGGPYWQDVKIPFSKFFLTSRGRIQDAQSALWLDKVNGIGITMGDQVTGPFKFEIDFIGVAIDLAHTEQFAYELYDKVK
uniref:complex I intermediate-associated protein 30, mitochondrial n=1 Tax=Myxine glutinosa TaxID=7769 RepID=UPI00358FBED1